MRARWGICTRVESYDASTLRFCTAETPKDVEINPEAGQAVFQSLNAEFGPGYFRHDRYQQKSGAHDFPVRMRDGECAPALTVSKTLTDVPVVSVDYVFADRSIHENADNWLKKNRIDVITPKQEEEDNGST